MTNEVGGCAQWETDLRPREGCVMGIDLGASHLHFAIADLRGEILVESSLKIRPEAGPRKLIAQTTSQVRRLMTRSRSGPLQALAMGVPSPVDASRGVVAHAINLPGWRNVRLGRALEREFRVPVFLENDANMAAIGEHWKGVARSVDHFVFIALGTGVGSGIFADGKLYRGRSGAAGEVHRMNLEWQRAGEDFGDVGYFESYASGLGIAAEGRRLLRPKPACAGRRRRRSRGGGMAGERDAYFVFASYRRGNLEARRILVKAFTLLGVGIANLVSVLDPELIVLGGGVAQGAPGLLLKTVRKTVQQIHPEPPPIKLSALWDHAQTYGAIISALTVASPPSSVSCVVKGS